MEKKRVLQFKLLGGIRFREAGETQWRSLESMGIKGVGKKQLAFLVYILLNNKRVITAEELVARAVKIEAQNTVLNRSSDLGSAARFSSVTDKSGIYRKCIHKSMCNILEASAKEVSNACTCTCARGNRSAICRQSAYALLYVNG